MAAVALLRDASTVQGNYLSKLRARAKLTQADIAEKIGVSIPQVSRWETGKDAMTSVRLPLIAEAYGCKVGEIFGEVPIGDGAGLPSEAELTALLSGILEAIPSDSSQAQRSRVLATALQLVVRQLARSPAIRSNPDAIREFGASIAAQVLAPN